jgi:hypothetical protein
LVDDCVWEIVETDKERDEEKLAVELIVGVGDPVPVGDRERESVQV